MSLGYQPGSAILHRAHPFTVITLCGGAAALAFLSPRPGGPVVVLGFALALTLVAGVWRILPTGLLIAAPFWVLLFVVHGVFRNDAATALTLASRVTAVIIAFLLLLAVVHPGRLVEALVARRIPFAVAYLLSAALQAVPRLRDRGVGILEAQRCRGLRPRGSVSRRVRAVVALAVPLVLGSLAEVDERALALDARGAGARTRRTALAPPKDRLAERVLRWSVAAAVAAAAWLALT